MRGSIHEFTNEGIVGFIGGFIDVMSKEFIRIYTNSKLNLSVFTNSQANESQLLSIAQE